MTLTLNKLNDIAVSGIVGGTPAGANSVILMANQAGRHLMSMHEWRFAEGAQTYLPFRISVPTSAASGSTLSGVYTEATKQLELAGAFANYSWRPGDLLQTFQAVGVPSKLHAITAKFDDDTIELATSLLDPVAVSGTVEFCIDLAWAELPPDFGETIAVEMSRSLTSRFKETNLGHLAALRSDAEGDSSFFRGAVSYAIPTVPDQPTARLELYPSPLVNDNKAMRMTYRHAWLEIDDDSSILRMPPFIEPLYLELFRCFLLGSEEHDLGVTDLRLQQVQLGSTFKAAKAADGRRQGNLGKMRGTHVRPTGYGINYSRRSIDSPA